MSKEYIPQQLINELLSAEAGAKIKQVVETISAIQQGLYAMADSEDNAQLNALKIGTVFTIFFIDTLASGKKPQDLTEEDWQNIAKQVYRYAVIEDGQSYSEFVFTMYADYIEVSAENLKEHISEQYYGAIMEVAGSIRYNTEMLRNGELTETAYVEACLWLSLEGMIKLLSAFITVPMKKEYAELVQAVTQLAFEYGRYVLFAKEQAILTRYIENQYALDEQLRADYEAYLAEVNEHAERFRKLIDGAFTTDLHEALVQSAALAREAGVKEEELLTTVEDVDAFFM